MPYFVPSKGLIRIVVRYRMTTGETLDFERFTDDVLHRLLAEFADKFDELLNILAQEFFAHSIDADRMMIFDTAIKTPTEEFNRRLQTKFNIADSKAGRTVISALCQELMRYSRKVPLLVADKKAPYHYLGFTVSQDGNLWLVLNIPALKRKDELPRRRAS